MNVITKILMISLALIFDIFEALITLLGIGVFITPILTAIEYMIFGVWFYFEGIKFTGKSNAGPAMMTTFFMEMVPILGALPGLTIGVIISIKSHEAELAEKESKKKEEEASKGENITRTKRRGA